MKIYSELKQLPEVFQRKWMANIQKAVPGVNSRGVYSLVDIKQTPGRSNRGQRVIVRVVDINGFPVPDVPVMAHFSTAKRDFLVLDETFTYNIPPTIRNGLLEFTTGAGEIDFIQGSPVKMGEPGGMTIYLPDPYMPSDIVTGMGMLEDHTGVLLVFQERVENYISLTAMMQKLREHDRLLAELADGNGEVNNEKQNS